MLRVALLVLFSLSLLGCDSQNKPLSSYQGFLITPGVGIKNLSLNDTVQQAESNFSKDFVVKNGYLHLPSKGIDASHGADNRIKAIFLYFRLPNYNAFNGITEKGIGINSSIEDVHKAYGPPTREGESVISEFGSVPGALEHSITYENLGIEFTFWDRMLADIRVMTPR